MGGIPIQYKQQTDSSGTGGLPGEIEIASEPRETRVFGDVEYVMEHALPTTVSLVKAAVADTRGNLIFAGTAQNSNPDCAMAGKICLAEAEKIVPAGELDPDSVHLSGVYVTKVLLATENVKHIERLRLSTADKKNDKQGGSNNNSVAEGGRGRIMRRAAKEFKVSPSVKYGVVTADSSELTILVSCSSLFLERHVC